VFECEDGLDEPGGTGGGVEVADVGFERADPAALWRDLVVGEGIAEGLHFDGIAHGRGGAVRFDHLDVARVEARVVEGGADDVALAADAGRGEADLVGAVVVDGAALEYGANRVAARDGVFQPHEADDGAAAAADGAGGVVGKGAAMAVG